MKQFYPSAGRLRRALTLACAGLGLHLGALAGPATAGAPVAATASPAAASLVSTVNPAALPGSNGWFQPALATPMARAVLAPSITLVTVTPGGLGQLIRITGSDLASVTTLTINGANALPAISNTATEITVRVPVTAAASGNIVLTNASGTATRAFTVMPAPGNALAFDGTNDRVTLTSPVTTDFTIEFWMYTRQTGGTANAPWYDGRGLVDAESSTLNSNDYGTSLVAGKVAFGLGNPDRTIHSVTSVNDGRWHHVAATREQASGTIRLYIDGKEEATATGTSTVTRNVANLAFGALQTNKNFFDGRLDEVRIWNTARTPAQIEANYLQVLTMPQAGLLLYHNFDQGTPGGDNTGSTPNRKVLYDLVNAQPATLNNFALSSGNVESNYVASFFLNIPTATAATNRTATSFTANWTAPTAIAPTGYQLEVSTNEAFTAPIADSPFNLSTTATSYTLTGLNSTSTYYYRVRASRTPGPEISLPSNVITVCVLPTAVAQNLTLPLTADGTATLLASAFSNGSTADCGPAGPGTLTLLPLAGTGVVSGEANEGGSLTLTAPAGAIFTSIEFASYGTPTGTGGSYTLGSCNAASSLAIVQQALLGRNSGTITADNATFGDPCSGTQKKLAVRARYYVVNPAGATPTPTLVFTCDNLGAQPVALRVTDAAGAVSIAVATVTITRPTVTATTWLGTVGTDWNNCRNWSFGQVPSAGIDAVVPVGLANYPNVASGTIATHDLTVTGSLTLGSAARLLITGNLLYSSSAPLAGTLEFTSGLPIIGPSGGSLSANEIQTISGALPITVNNLQLRKSSGSVQLLQNVTVTGSLQLATGGATEGRLLTGNAFAVTLGPAATITETETAYVTGTVRTTRPVVVGSTQAFGGLGLTLTPAPGSVAPGNTEVVRTTGLPLSGIGTSQSILRYFQVTPATLTGIDATLVFSYFEHERNDILEADLRLFRNATTGPAGWSPQAAAVFNLTANTATLTGTTVLGFWTLGSVANPLPVQLTRFEATPAGAHAVRLSWATAQELNSADFVVERSLDGRRFEPVGTVAAAGTSSSARHYTLLDSQLPTGAALLYYRLRQTDLDGKVARSEVRTVSLSATAALTLAPNPTQGVATLRGAAATVPVQVLDATGRLVLSTTTDANGSATLALPATLPRGVYVVRAGSHTTRLVLE